MVDQNSLSLGTFNKWVDALMAKIKMTSENAFDKTIEVVGDQFNEIPAQNLETILVGLNSMNWSDEEALNKLKSFERAWNWAVWVITNIRL